MPADGGSALPRDLATGAMRRVLMVAFHFPPQKGSSGAQRILRFVQYLPRHGWAPAVLTASPQAYGECSAEQLDDIPASVPVTRAWALDASRHLAIRGKYLEVTALPDRHSTWIPSGLLAGWRRIRQWRPQVLFSTYPLGSAHAIGAGLQWLSGLPWVADIRDPMTGDGSPARGWRHRIHRWIETRVARRAARVVFATAEARDEFRRVFPAVPATRLHVVENGFDEGDFRKAEAWNREHAGPRDDTTLTLLHSGLLSPDTRSPLAFLEALARVLEAGIYRGRRVRVLMRASQSEGVHRPLAERLGLAEVVQWAPGRPYREALAEMMTVDGLLVFQGRQHDAQIPAKIYEYCRAGRPVMGLVGMEGKTARFLREEGLPHLAPLEDREAIEPVLREFLDGLIDGTAPAMSRERAMRFSREGRTAELAAILDSLVPAGATVTDRPTATPQVSP